MRITSLLLALLLVGMSTPTEADNWLTTSNIRDGEKEEHGSGIPFDGGFVGGDTVDDAFPIPGLPFYDTGNNCGYEDDYDFMCPYGGWSPDVVYSFSPETDMAIDIDLCNSRYDTKLIV